ncbi:NAD-dependent epimerase/dehydratase family protein [Cellulomonas sp. DKR-3]|uniref:NAD-dependent epimerase/dehydratase family protein n=1 Tax=Cellulomonas fulva TaxID=2835530 RepID=A0ABS5TZ37_9CELL|nr:NAD-dependent epimerase/dehydratase family protein [Cellulomonas fulva]MBT0994418.1 NAD-dependent epimerase/dehydratase family protein [Cellulomonas fulva]
MNRHVVIGKGPVGTSLARLLGEAGHEVVVVSRTGASGGTRPAQRGPFTHVAADAADPAALAAVVHGAAALYQCANPRYDRWPALWPALHGAAMEAASAAGAVLVVAGNLYGYGEGSGVMREDTPLLTEESKGRVRATMWQQAVERGRADGLRVVEVRASDYLGPYATGDAHAGARLLEPVLRGGVLRPVGDPDQPHSWTYLPDYVAALAAAAVTPAAWGRPVLAPTGAPLTYRQLAERLAARAGRPVPRIAPVPRPVLGLAGLVIGQLREVNRMRYQFDAPFVVDSSASERLLGLTPTPWDRVVDETVAWWSERAATSAPA